MSYSSKRPAALAPPIALTVNSTHRLKHSIHVAIVGPSYQARAPNQPCADIVDNVTIEIGHHHDIELLRVGHQLQGKEGPDKNLSRTSPGYPGQDTSQPSRVTNLHSGVVHNHTLKGDLGVGGCHFLAALEEEPISQFPG